MQYLLMIYSEEDSWNTLTDSERQQGVAAYAAYWTRPSRGRRVVPAR